MALAPDDVKASGQIVNLYNKRIMERSGLFRRMKEIRDHYNGDVLVPLPELDDAERPAIPNLIAQAIDQFAMRVSSVVPDINYPSLRPGIQLHDNRARDRRLATLGWWDMNSMQTKVRRRSRHLTAYGMSAVSLSPVPIDPSDKREIPFWRVRNPLSTFPAQMLDPDMMEPEDCIFADVRTLAWLKENYPIQTNVLYRGTKTDSDLFSVLEYMDACETVLVAVGAEKPKEGLRVQYEIGKGAASNVILERIPNRAEICPVVIAGRITLDRLQGQFDQMLGMYQRWAKLDALNTIAVFRGVFPDEWVVSPANSPTSPRVVQEADGKMGIRGIIDRGQIQIVHPQQTQDAAMAAANLERSQRLTGGVPAEFGGESPSNVRTGRRGAQVMSETIDMQLQEYQEIMANSQTFENVRAVKIQRAYYGKKPSMFFFSSDGDIALPDYTPNVIFDTHLSKVFYPLPGSDANQMSVRIGQKVGIGLMSNETARVLDPDIKDPMVEGDKVEIEGLRKALLSGAEQKAAQGDMDPIFIAKIAKLKTQRHMTLEDAFIQVDKEAAAKQAEQAQQQQAQQQQAQQQGQQPQAPGPEQQPGMSVSPTNPVQQAPQQQPQDLQSLLSQLGGPQGGTSGPPIAQSPAAPQPGV